MNNFQILVDIVFYFWGKSYLFVNICVLGKFLGFCRYLSEIFQFFDFFCRYQIKIFELVLD